MEHAKLKPGVMRRAILELREHVLERTIAALQRIDTNADVTEVEDRLSFIRNERLIAGMEGNSITT